MGKKRGNPYHDPKNGEFTNGPGGGVTSSGPVKYDMTGSALLRPGRFASLTKPLPGPPPLPGESWGERNVRLAQDAYDKGIAPPNVIGADARRTYEAGMARALNESPRYFVKDGAKKFKKPKKALAIGNYTGATDALRTLPRTDPVFKQYALLGIQVPTKDGPLIKNPPRVRRAIVKAPAIHHTVNGASSIRRHGRG